MKKYLLVLFSGLMFTGSRLAVAQDIHFSQFPEITTLRNPGLTGLFSGDFKVGIDYRSQWAQWTDNPYTTAAISGETRVLVNREQGDYLSFGLDVSYDKAGATNFTTTEIYPALCYNKSMMDEHNTYLSVGMTGGFFSRSVNMSQMTFTNQYINLNFDKANPTGENFAYNSTGNYDLGAGVSINSSFDEEGRTNYYLGAGLFHINHPTEIFAGADNLTKLPMRWDFNGGFHVSIARNWGLTLHGDYSLQDPYSEFGGLISWHNTPIYFPSNFTFSFGAYVRNGDAIIPTVKLDVGNVAVGVSMDISTSNMATLVPGTGATELTLFIKGKYLHAKNPLDNVNCPKFDQNNVNQYFR